MKIKATFATRYRPRLPQNENASALVINFGTKTDQVRVRSTYQEVIDKLNGQ